MQRIIKRFAALFTALLLILPLTSAAFYADEAEITAIVSFEDGADAEKTLAGIKAAVPSASVRYTYGVLFYGAAITVGESDFYKQSGIFGVESAKSAAAFAMPETESESGSSTDGLDADSFYSTLRYDTGEYKGDGTVVAVIDNGFYAVNQHFALTDESSAKLTETDVASLYKSLNGTGKYYSAKLPYVCDYRSGGSDGYSRDPHGMNIAGIIGANSVNSKDDFNGVAPEAQLLLMKVFDDSAGSTADEADIIAALEDAYLLGCDVINLSLGVPCGNENGQPFDESLGAALDKLCELGVVVVCAGGNSGRIGSGDYYDESYSIDYPLASEPDYGTTPAPASVGSTTAVGALSAGYSISTCFTAADGTKIAYSDTSAGYMKDENGDSVSFAAYLDGLELEYTVVQGVGTKDDMAKAGALTGKVALIQRGEVTFAEKCANAKAAGAVGVIIYDNVISDSLVSMSLEGCEIPAVFVSRTDGLLLRDAKIKRITVKRGDSAKFDSSNPNLPVTYSSWGVTPGFTLKPDVSAVGSNVYSLMNGTFGFNTGTSLAAGFVSGGYALLKQYASENNIDDSPAYLKALMMNTASPASTDSKDIENVDYSPRVQGAGKLDLTTLFDCDVLITGNSGASAIRGDGLGSKFTIDLTLTNLTGEDKTVKLSSTVGGDSYITYEDGDYEDDMPYFVTGVPAAFNTASVRIGELWGNLNRYSENYDPVEVKLAAGEELNLKLTVYIPRELKNEYDSVFTSGWYIEGFIYADAGGTVSSIPFVGFCGDWDSVPVYDSTVYSDVSDSSPAFDGVSVWSVLTSGRFADSTVTLGVNYTADASSPNSQYIAFSPNDDGDCDYAAITLYLLRNIESAEYTIYDAYGGIAASDVSGGAMYKSALISSKLRSYSFKLWNGAASDNSSYIYPDGSYTIEFTFSRSGSDTPQTLTVTAVSHDDRSQGPSTPC